MTPSDPSDPTAPRPAPGPLEAARQEVEATGVEPAQVADKVAGAEQAGDTIGRYKLLQEIGQGGMGTVWMASQHEPVQRKVALKIIKLGMDTREVVRRFEAERQALALMDHPNIAKVHDGGSTEQGRPYFVMELVRGTPITEFCDHAKLGVRERLELFTRVCEALQHAHHKGVIHRDVKPSNVMVTLHDGVPVPKVIDFGIAKATSAELTQKTLFTEYAQVLGTPEYMAPEQAEMSGLDIDTRADVYSLGVLLYELLTGTRPFDLRRALGVGFEELLRTIREDDPAKPSTRVSTLGAEASPLAASRHSNVDALSRHLRGDLDWIVMKALEKDRGRRYETASSFAADVERFLRDEAVLAAPPSHAYRARKFVRRNRAQVLGAAGVLLMLLIGMAGTGWGLLRALDERERAELAEAQARVDLNRALAVQGVIRSMFEQIRPSHAMGEDTVLLRRLMEHVEGQLERSEVEDLEVQAELHGIVGGTYWALGLVEEADRHLPQAYEISHERYGEADERTMNALSALAHLRHSQSRQQESFDLLDRHIALCESQYGPEDRRTLHARFTLGAALGNERIYDRALELQLAVLEDSTRVYGRYDKDTVRLSTGAVTALLNVNRLEEALALLEEMEPHRLKWIGVDHPDSIRADVRKAGILARLGRLEEAREVLGYAVERSRRILGEDHDLTAGYLADLASVLDDLGENERALELMRESHRIGQAASGEHSNRTRLTERMMLEVQDKSGDRAQAIAGLRDLARWEAANLGERDLSLADTRSMLARALQKDGQHEEAAELLRTNIRNRESWKDQVTRDLFGDLDSLTQSLFQLNRIAEVEPVLRRMIEVGDTVGATNERSCLGARVNLGLVLVREGRAEDAIEILLPGLEGMRSHLEPLDPFIGVALRGLAEAHGALGQREESLARAREGLAFERERAEASGEPRLMLAVANLFLFSEDEEVHDPTQALSVAEHALELAEAAELPDLWSYVGTLANAHHRNGDADRAVALQERALAFGPEIIGARMYPGMQANLQEYRKALEGEASGETEAEGSADDSSEDPGTAPEDGR